MSEIINFQDVPKEPTVPQFDPNKKYTWTPNDTFTLSGGEFGVVLNALRATIGTQESARILLAKEAHDVIEGTLAKAVESGVVKEALETSN